MPSDPALEAADEIAELFWNEKWNRTNMAEIIRRHYAASSPQPAQWISVKEKLPEAFQSPNGLRNYVFIFGKEADPQIGLAFFDPERETWLDGDGTHEWTEQVTHWMPLPAAPEEKP